MTALCGGGTSGPKPGVAELILYDAGGIANLMLRTGNFWLAIAAPLVGVLAYEALNFCGGDPPQLPVFTQAEAQALNQIIVGPDLTSALAKYKDTVLYNLWFDYCQCTSAPQPKITQAMPQPAGLQIISQSNACKTDAPWEPIGQPWASDGTLSTFAGFQGDIAPGATAIIWSGTSTPVAGGGWAPGPLNLQFTTAADQLVPGYEVGNAPIATLPVLGPFQIQLDVPQTGTAAKFNVSYQPQAGPGAVNQIHAQLDSLCGAASGDCCPPDPMVAAQLQKILDQLQQLLAGSAGQGTYKESNIHNGLSGSGRVSLGLGTVAVRVDITTDNPSLPVLPGNPPYLWDRGFIVPLAAEGPIRRQTRLTYNPQLYPLPPQAEQVGYQLGAGIVATVTELVIG